MAEKTTDAHFLSSAADRCVMCGLCLPHCPTYRLCNRESESPRGRIALIRALASGELPPTPRLMEHLDHCLVCRACERACPAEVPYGELIDTARALLAQEGRAEDPSSGPDRLLNDVTRLERWRPLLRFYQGSGIQRMARALRAPEKMGLGSLERLLPPLPRNPRWHRHYPATGNQRGRVALFTGCTGRALDGATLQAAIRILSLLGYSVTLPDTQTCCGALHLHAGAPEDARRLAIANLAAFENEEVDAVIHVTSGCGIHLMEYPRLPGLTRTERQRAKRFAKKVFEISQFIETSTWPAALDPLPLKSTAAVHIPCSLQQPGHHPEYTFSLLRRIPGLELTPLPDNALCCGAAGDYLLRHPDTARALLTPKLDALEALQAPLLITANIGCALHFRAALQEGKRPVEVLHPVTLLARQLPEPTDLPSRGQAHKMRGTPQ